MDVITVKSLTSRTSVGNKIVDHSDIVGASPGGAAPTASSFSTEHLASIYWAKTTPKRNGKHLTSPMTLTFDFSWSNFKIAVSQELVSDWFEKKKKKIDYMLDWLYCLALWPHPWPWPCSFKVKVWNNLIWRMGGLIDMERKGCESIIHDHDCDLWVAMVGWVDARDNNFENNWGDFRCWHAVDIST